MKTIKQILLYLWQLPQNLLALIIWGILGPIILDGGHFEGKKVLISEGYFSSFSLGHYLFMIPNSSMSSFIHEYGHSVQSLYLGWLYIPIIVIPSVLHNLYRRIKRLIIKPKDLAAYHYSYYEFYTEKWANLLGIRKVNHK